MDKWFLVITRLIFATCCVEKNTRDKILKKGPKQYKKALPIVSSELYTERKQFCPSSFAKLRTKNVGLSNVNCGGSLSIEMREG